MVYMELSFKNLKKREVINLADGSSFGHIIDVELSFPKGNLVAIIVPGKSGKGLFGFFWRDNIRIEERDIIKIGGDAILVNVRCGESCASYVNVNPPAQKPPQPKPRPPCPPPPPTPCGQKDFGGECNKGVSYTADYSDF